MSERGKEIQGSEAKKNSALGWVIDNTLGRFLDERSGIRAGRPAIVRGPQVEQLSPEEVIAIAQGNFSRVHPEKVDGASLQND